MFLPLFSIGQDKVKFVAAGITCSMCSNAIHKSLMRDSSITFVAPNLNTQEWFLEYSPKGSFSLEKLKKLVEDAGFSLSKVWLGEDLIFQSGRKRK